MTTEEIIDNLIQLNINCKLYNENPQDQSKVLLNNQVLLNPDSYNTGNIKVLALSNVPSGSSDQEIFDINKEIISEDCNTVVLASEYPFSLQINEGDIHEDIYHFSYTSINQFSIAVSNQYSESITIRYLIAKADLLGSSYIYA
jgi:hypothetical protein